MTSTILLRLDHVSYCVGQQVLLNNLSIELKKESFTAVLGPNGSGKTLFLQLCHGLIKPAKGHLSWSNKPPKQTMVFQNPVLLRRTALDNISYVLRDLTRKARRAAAEAALEWAQLEYLALKPASVLSVGEQQQLALARAKAFAADVLYLDEPTANLDPNARVRIEGLIRSLHQSGTKIVMTTHNLAQAQRMADDIAFINDGIIESHQSNDAFFASPASRLAASFIESEAIHFA